MNHFLSLYQYLPEKISPTAFQIGSFSIGWYPLMYIAAFLMVYLLLRWRVKKKEAGPHQGDSGLELLEKFIFYSFLGVIIGGRLGYVVFYNFSYYLDNLSAVFIPLDAAGKFVGIYGMSYHGGLIGVILATWYFCKNNKIYSNTKKPDKSSGNNISGTSLKESGFGVGLDFWQWADFVVPAVPAGFFFGRIGNFLNGELYGRTTAKVWGMYFPAGGEVLRHPSQLYEAFFEGIILFIILWSVRNGIRYRNKIFRVPCFLLYAFLYGLFRFCLEFFRAPDQQLGFILKWGEKGLTMGQILSLGMVLIVIFVLIIKKENKVYNSA